MNREIPAPSRVEPVASIVVATRDRGGLLPRLVRALRAQDGIEPYEIIVVDDGSEDHAEAELRRLAEAPGPPLRVLRHHSPRGPGAARNTGWRAATAPIVAFTDDDCVPEPTWLAALVAGFSSDEIGLVQGATLPDPAQVPASGPFSRTIDVRSETGHYQTCNIAYRRSVLEALGGFDERFRRAGEDMDLAWRARAAGWATRFVSGARVHHDVRPSSFAVHLRDLARWEGIVLLVREHPGLRAYMHNRWMWKRSHPHAIAAVLGTVALVGPSRLGRILGAGALANYVRFRIVVWPLPGRRRAAWAAVPLALVADLVEVGVLARASVRYRSVLL